MPDYRYRNTKTGEFMTLVRPAHEAFDPVILDDGTECVFDREAMYVPGLESVVAAAARSAERAWRKPMYSDGLGVAASQVEEARRRFPKRTFLDDGRMVLRSAAERREALKEAELHDRAAWR